MAAVRSTGSRSRGGCQRCKSKHIKCDETKPECQICRANNIKCPGYDKLLKWSTKYERPRKSTRQATSTIVEKAATQMATSLEEQTAQSSSSHDTSFPGVDWNESTYLGLLPDAAPMWPDLDGYGFDDLNFISNLLPSPPMVFDSTVLTASLPAAEDSGMYDATTSLPQTINDEDSRRPVMQHNTSTVSAISTMSTAPPASGVHKSKRSNSSTTYLRTFYRQTLPNQMSGFSDQDFVHHYFKSVAPLLSCFDSDMNPFRTMVTAQWTSCQTTCMTVQALAVAHLLNHYPSLSRLAAKKRSQAWQLLQRDLYLYRQKRASASNLLLNLLLLGLSSSWHRSSDLGIQYLLITRRLMQLEMDSLESSFFPDALMYWEMLISFVDPSPIIALPGRLFLPEPDECVGAINIHPLVGISVDVHFALAEIGRIVRRQNSTADDANAGFDRDWSTRLEAFLVSRQFSENIEDYHDPRTPPQHLFLVARAYRFLGLLELWRLYPDLLDSRLDSSFESENELLEILRPLRGEQVSSLLGNVAKYTLQLVERISLASCACRLLPLVLVALASHVQAPGSDENKEHDEDVVADRTLIEERLLDLSRKYPQRPGQQMLDIVRETWHRVDESKGDSHWLQIANEKGWQTLFG